MRYGERETDNLAEGEEEEEERSSFSTRSKNSFAGETYDDNRDRAR